MVLDAREELTALQQWEREHLADMEDLIRRTGDLVIELWAVKKPQIIEYAEKVWRMVGLGADIGVDEKNQVSIYTRGKYKEHGANDRELRYVSEILSPLGYTRGYDKDDEFPEFDNLRMSNDGQSTTAELPSVEKIIKSDNSTLDDQYQREVEYKKALQAKVKAVADRLSIYETEGEKRHLRFSQYHKEQPVTTGKGDPRETDSWVALGEHIETLQGVREKLYEYPPEKEEDETIASAIRDYNAVFKPFNDLKYSKSFPEWIQVQLTNEAKGKHASAVLHATVLPDGSKRPMTREQCGDSAEDILEKSYKALMAIPIIGHLAKWHRRELEPKVAQRKVDLSPKLSERA